MNIRTVLVGLDSSERAKKVLKAAVDLAEHYDAKLVAVRGVGLPVDFPDTILPISANELADKLLETNQASLSALVASVPTTRLLKAEARYGTPWQVVCTIAKEANADVVVVGTHSRNALDVILGTTASRITNHAPCSVLVVRDNH
ncbi:MAG: universal stress protein [Sandaracinaceae bacterium]|nr:universal stress protein [Sandaracinaceae bacterium]